MMRPLQGVDGDPLVDLGDEAHVGSGLAEGRRRRARPPRSPRRAGAAPPCAGGAPPGSTAISTPCTSRVWASFSVTLRIRSGSEPGPGTSPLRVTCSASRMRSTVSRGAGMKFKDRIFCRFSRSFSSASGSTRSPAAVAATTPRKARLGRIGQSRDSASSLPRVRSWMNFPAWCFTSRRILPEQTAVELGGGHALGLAVDEDAGTRRIGGEAQGAQRVLHAHGLDVVVLGHRGLEGALRRLVALLAQLDEVAAQVEVRDLHARGSPRGIEASRPRRLVEVGSQVAPRWWPGARRPPRSRPPRAR